MKLQSDYCRCHHEERAYCPDQERTVVASWPPDPTRCDCRFNEDGETICGVHSPPVIMYYEPEETE